MTEEAPPPQRQFPPTYQVGVFALVRKRDAVLLVRPHQLLLPGGPQSLPGTLLRDTKVGMGMVEGAIRRTLLSQVGISVGELRLAGSHMLRAPNERRAVTRLNLIFASDYNSGILNPQPADLKSANWFIIQQLEKEVPEWLRAALQELQTIAPPGSAEPAAPAGVGLFGRRRTAEK